MAYIKPSLKLIGILPCTIVSLNRIEHEHITVQSVCCIAFQPCMLKINGRILAALTKTIRWQRQFALKNLISHVFQSEFQNEFVYS